MSIRYTKKEKAEMARVKALNLKEGDKIWLKPFEDLSDPKDPIREPRQKATVLSYQPGDFMMVAQVRKAKDDDGLREFSVDQVEGRA